VHGWAARTFSSWRRAYAGERCVVRELPRELRRRLDQDAALVRTGLSAAAGYGWHELSGPQIATWSLDAYIAVDSYGVLQERPNQLDLDNEDDGDSDPPAGSQAGDSVLLRVVDEPWPFPPHYTIAPQPLAALDLLAYADQVARRIGPRGSELARSSEAVRARPAIGQSSRSEWPARPQADRAEPRPRATAAGGG
jgi:hypothetical protein